MTLIDLDTWPRRVHYETYRQFDHPHFNLTAAINVDHMLPIAQEYNASLTIIITYLLTRTANQIENFRWRIRDEVVIEHDVVHPSITILTADQLFSFCTMAYTPEFSTFAAEAATCIAHVREHPTLENKTNEDDLLFMTSIPWVSFTSFMHPLHTHPVDSIPRIAWGKIHEVEGRQKMPLSVQGHHALMDGLHVGHFFEKMQENCDRVEAFLDS
jgi:chloramphenicol O-acetyltransferase type A